MTEEDRRWWKEILLFVEKKVLLYDDNQKLQKNGILRVRGLQHGKIMANNKTQDNGNYPLEVVYISCVTAQSALDRAIKTGTTFDSDEAKLAYFCAIARNKLNDTYELWKKRENQKSILGRIQQEPKHYGAKYKPKNIKKGLTDDIDKLW